MSPRMFGWFFDKIVIDYADRNITCFKKETFDGFSRTCKLAKTIHRMRFTNKRQLHLDIFAGWNIVKHAHMSYTLKIRRLFQNFLYTLQLFYPLQNKNIMDTSNTQFYEVRWMKPVENLHILNHNLEKEPFSTTV